MTEYATLEDLLAHYGARELAGAASADHQKVAEAALVLALVKGGSTTGFTAEQKSIANAAIEVIEAKLAAANERIDETLARSGHAMPIAPPPPLARLYAKWIARYYLGDDAPVDEGSRSPVRSRYEEALAWLNRIEKGLVRYGDAIAPKGLAFSAPSPAFSRDPG